MLDGGNPDSVGVLGGRGNNLPLFNVHSPPQMEVPGRAMDIQTGGRLTGYAMMVVFGLLVYSLMRK